MPLQLRQRVKWKTVLLAVSFLLSRSNKSEPSSYLRMAHNNINMSELYIPIERPTRNLVNGRFLKGHSPHNKGKKLKFHSRWSKRRCLKNLEKGRSIPHKTGGGTNKKAVVAIKDRKLVGRYDSVISAGEKLNITPSHISDVCLKKKGHKTVRGYKMYFESDNDWFTEIDYKQ